MSVTIVLLLEINLEYLKFTVWMLSAFFKLQYNYDHN